MTILTREQAVELPVACRTLGGPPISRLEMAIRNGDRPPLRVGDFVELPPCVETTRSSPPWPELAAFAEEHGRPCPRVDLHPANYDAATLFWMALAEEGRPLFGPFLRTCTRGASWFAREGLLRRVWSAIQDPAIRRALWPTPEPAPRKR